MQDSEEITKNLFPLSSIHVYSPSLVRLQCLLLALYRMVLPVLILATVEDNIKSGQFWSMC